MLFIWFLKFRIKSQNYKLYHTHKVSLILKNSFSKLGYGNSKIF
jgi:hypothetical protein